MSEHIVKSEGEAEQVLGIICKFLESPGTEELPKHMNIVVPTKKFKALMSKMIVETINECESKVPQDFQFTVNVFTKEDLTGNDEAPA